eukprot:scaffold129895_cov19-Tisochrysis_lutea.AAC.3
MLSKADLHVLSNYVRSVRHGTAFSILSSNISIFLSRFQQLTYFPPMVHRAPLPSRHGQEHLWYRMLHAAGEWSLEGSSVPKSYPVVCQAYKQSVTVRFLVFDQPGRAQRGGAQWSMGNEKDARAMSFGTKSVHTQRNTGTQRLRSRHGLLTTVAYKLGPETPVMYALEGLINPEAKRRF